MLCDPGKHKCPISANNPILTSPPHNQFHYPVARRSRKLIFFLKADTNRIRYGTLHLVVVFIPFKSLLCTRIMLLLLCTLGLLMLLYAVPLARLPFSMHICQSFIIHSLDPIRRSDMMTPGRSSSETDILQP